MGAEGPSEADLAFARLVVEQRLATPAHVEECLKLLRELAAGGVSPLPRLGEILSRKGYLAKGSEQDTVKASPPSGHTRAGESTTRTPSLPNDASTASADPENVIGRYVRVSRLGAGAMGEVWRAWDRDLRRWVALKFLKGQNPDELARFLREAQTAAKLSHAHIATVYDVGEHAGRPFIAMQLVDGQTLATFPRDDRRALVEILRDAARAVHHAHEQGVIHRDLKPHNIMVEGGRGGEGRRVFVMDFGLAKETEIGSALSVSGNILGTPSYMSPEQARGHSGRVDARSDVYSLGATLHELLVSRPPFQADTVFDLLVKVVSEEARPLRRHNPRIDRDLETIVAKCLEKEPGRRYAGARELADELQRWLDREPIQARPASLAYRLRKRVMRNLPLSAAIAAAVLIALAGGTTVVVQSLRGAAEREGMELCRQALEDVKEAKALWRIKASRREQWEELFGRALRSADAAIARFPGLAAAHFTRGEILEAQGRWKEAIEAHSKVLALDPSMAAAWQHRGLCHLEIYAVTVQAPIVRDGIGAESVASRQSRAEVHKRRAVDDLRRHASLSGVRQESSAEVRLAQAAFALAEGRPEESERDCDALLRETPTDDRVWLLKALAQGARLRFADALATLTTLITDVTPQLARAYRTRGLAHAALLDWTRAEADLSKALELDPKDAATWTARALVRIYLNTWPEAVVDATRAVELDPTFASAYLARSAAKLFAGDRRGAYKDIAKAISLDPHFAGVYSARSWGRRAFGDLKGSLQDAHRAIDMDPKFAWAYVNRALTRLKLGDIAGATSDYKTAADLDAKLHVAPPGQESPLLLQRLASTERLTQAIEREPSNARNFFLRGVVKEVFMDPKGCAEDCTRAIGLDARFAAAYNQRGWVRKALLDAKGAMEDWSRAIECDPGLAEAWSNRAAAHARQGDWKEAVVDYTKALESDPGFYLDHCGRAAALQRLEDLDGAIADYTKALEMEPEVAVHRAARGRVHLAKGDAARALEDFRRAARDFPEMEKELSKVTLECEKKLGAKP